VSWFEDLRIGDQFMTGRHVFGADDIVAFARRFDPQAFHVDEAAAARSHFGALCASGWHTAIAWMRLMLEHRRSAIEAARARGERIGQYGPALGMRDLRWLKPVYAGDALDYRSEIVEMRVSNSRPRFGLITIRTTGTNQRGELAISWVSTSFVERRPEQT
jgi:acyl dehydratase